MKLYTLLSIPLTFVAGIVSVVLLQKADIVHIGAQQSNTVVQAGSISTSSTTNAIKDPAQDMAGQSSSEGMNNLQLSERIDTLQQQLRDSTSSADKMQVRIDELEDKLELALVDSRFLPTGDPTGEQSGNELAAVEQTQNGGNARGGRGFGDRPSSDEQYEHLIAAGVDPIVADELKRQSDQWTLQRLELVDQATREGWRRSDEFGDRMAELRESQPDIRDELGEQSYDKFLFASGGNNRVQVSSILQGSAAQLAGMQNGDVVMNYADSRVFSMRELQRSTSSGSRGESVQVQVLRNGQLLTVDVPRGPLGVTLSGARSEPEP